MPARSSLLIAALLASACSSATPPAQEGSPAYLPPAAREAAAREAAQSAALDAALTSGAWLMTDLSGTPLEGALISFSDDGTASGRAGCNRFNATYSREGTMLSFGPTATTRMACAPAAMDQERRVMATLARVISVGLSEEGVLFLATLEGDVLQLRPEG